MSKDNFTVDTNHFNSNSLLGVVMLTQGFLSFLLNGMFLIVIAANRILVKRKRITYHVLNLAIADSLYGFSNACLFVVESGLLKRVFVALHRTAVLVSLSAILLMAVERAVVVRKPFTWAKILPLKRIVLIFVNLWIATLIAAVIVFFYPSEFPLYGHIVSLFLVIFIVVVNCYIVRTLRSDSHNSTSLLSNRIASQRRELHRKASSLVISLSVILVVTALPHMVYAILTSTLLKTEFYSSQVLFDVDIYFHVLMLMNFLVNPVIYIWKVGIYRKAFCGTIHLSTTSLSRS